MNTVIIRRKTKIAVYNCCFNRPFDDQSYLSIFLETYAKLAIQDLVNEKEINLIWSFILDYENNAYKIEVTAVTETGYEYFFSTNFTVSNVMVTYRATFKDPIDINRTVYLAGNTSLLGMVGDEWNPQGQAMARVDAYTYETETLIGMYESMSYEITMGNWGLKGKSPNGEDIHNTVKITNTGQLVEFEVDNWGLISGEIKHYGAFFSFTGDGTKINVAYTQPSATNVTFYYSYDGDYFTPMESELTQFCSFEVPAQFGRTLHYYFSNYDKRTNQLDIPLNNVPFNFVVFGDFHNNTDVDIIKQIPENEDPAFVVNVGDLVYDGHGLDDWDKLLLNFKSIYTNFLHQSTLDI